jgi:hypothetical protein
MNNIKLIYSMIQKIKYMLETLEANNYYLNDHGFVSKEKYKKQELLSTSSINSIGVAMQDIDKLFKKRITINKKHTSYGYKHDLEDYNKTYFSNGEFIMAMLLLGYNFRCDGDSPNAFFNVSKKKF